MICLCGLHKRYRRAGARSCRLPVGTTKLLQGRNDTLVVPYRGFSAEGTIEDCSKRADSRMERSCRLPIGVAKICGEGAVKKGA